MTVTPFDGRPSSRSSLMTWPDAPSEHLPADDRKQRAVTHLIEYGVLSNAFGRHGEYKVRTTMTTRKVWQYRCSVLHHGRDVKGAFFPIIAERKPVAARGAVRPSGAEDIRLSFALEAVEIHFTRCAALQEYLMLSALYDRPKTRSRGWYALVAPLLGIAALVAYGFWAHAFRIDGGQLAGSLSSLVADQLPVIPPKDVPPLASSRQTTSSNSTNPEASPTGSADRAEEVTAIDVTDLLARRDSRETADQTVRISRPGAAISDLQVGDMLRVTGWVQRISRAPDSSYHLYLSPNRQAGAQLLVATVPPPHQGQRSPAGQAELQAVRTFIRQQLLRQQEPSARGSVMRRPIFVRLTGQLSMPSAPPAAPSPGNRSQPMTARWEIRPTLDVQFGTPAEL